MLLLRKQLPYQPHIYFSALKTKLVLLKVFYADKKPLIMKARLHSSLLNTNQSVTIIKCHLLQGDWQRSQQWLSAETSSSKVDSIMKGVFNNEEAVGPLAVARQLHQQYSGTLEGRFKGKDMQRYVSMWEKCGIRQCMQWSATYLLLHRRFWCGYGGGADQHSGPQCHCCSFVSFTGT